jgi:hypothetical protein
MVGFHGLQKISLFNPSGRDLSEHKIARELHRRRAARAWIRHRRTQWEVSWPTSGRGWNKQFLKRHFSNVKATFTISAVDIDKPTG